MPLFLRNFFKIKNQLVFHKSLERKSHPQHVFLLLSTRSVCRCDDPSFFFHPDPFPLFLDRCMPASIKRTSIIAVLLCGEHGVCVCGYDVWKVPGNTTFPPENLYQEENSGGLHSSIAGRRGRFSLKICKKLFCRQKMRFKANYNWRCFFGPRFKVFYRLAARRMRGSKTQLP